MREKKHITEKWRTKAEREKFTARMKTTTWNRMPVSFTFFSHSVKWSERIMATIMNGKYARVISAQRNRVVCWFIFKWWNTFNKFFESANSDGKMKNFKCLFTFAIRIFNALRERVGRGPTVSAFLHGGFDGNRSYAVLVALTAPADVVNAQELWARESQIKLGGCCRVERYLLRFITCRGLLPIPFRVGGEFNHRFVSSPSISLRPAPYQTLFVCWP